MDKDEEIEIEKLIEEKINEFRKEEFYSRLKELEDKLEDNIQRSKVNLLGSLENTQDYLEDRDQKLADYLKGRITWVGAILFGLIFILYYLTGYIQ